MAGLPQINDFDIMISDLATSLGNAAGVPRESLYRALSANGNPRFPTLHAVLRAAGLKMAVEVV